MPIKEQFVKNPFYKNINSSAWTYTKIGTTKETSVTNKYCSIH